jgi:hypothetical protein
MGSALVPLIIQARGLLRVSQGELGELLGSSRRTGQRWEGSGSVPMDPQLHQLAGLVHPHDPKLAADLARAGGTTLEKLGIELPPPPPPVALPPPPPPPPPPEDVVDAVVCAAAEAIDIMPRAIRPALLAAFTRARRIGLSVEAVERALEATAATDPKRDRNRAK